MIAADWCHGASLGPAWLEAEGHRILKLNIGTAAFGFEVNATAGVITRIRI